VQEPGDVENLRPQSPRSYAIGFRLKGDVFVVTLAQSKIPATAYRRPAGFNAAFSGALDSAIAVDVLRKRSVYRQGETVTASTPQRKAEWPKPLAVEAFHAGRDMVRTMSRTARRTQRPC